MEAEELEKRLHTLTKDEATCLYWKAKGLDNADIPKKVGRGIDWVQHKISDGYKKLGIKDMDLSNAGKETYFLTTYSTAIIQMVEGKPVTAEKKEEPMAGKKSSSVLPIFIGAGLLIVLIAIGLTVFRPGKNQPVTVISTSTTAPTPTVKTDYFFEDTFDNKPSKEWEIQGDYIISNGGLVAQSNVYMFIGDTNWKNYEITADISEFHHNWRVPDAYIFVHSKDQNTGYSYQMWIDEGVWVRSDNGDAQALAGTNGPFTMPIVITVKDDKMEVKNGKSLIDSRFPEGRVGIFLSPRITLKYFSVKLLP